MADRGGERPQSPPRLRRRAQTWLFSLALVALVLGTAAGVVLARQRAVDAVQDRARRAAGSGAALLEIELREVAAGLSGAGAIVGPDGALDVEVFRAYAGDPLAGDEARELSLIAMVPRAERAAFEERIGAPITVVGERGRTSPAPEAPEHHAVVSVLPDLPGRGFVGFDLSSESRRLRRGGRHRR